MPYRSDMGSSDLDFWFINKIKPCIAYHWIQVNRPEMITLVIESWIASLLSVLLSFVGVSSVAEGSVVYVPSLDHRFVVTLSCVDVVGICLWAFMFVFVVWVYSNLEGIPLSHRKYTVLGILGFTIFFFANIFRMFIEIFYVANVGASYVSYLAQWQAFEEQVGIGIMFATFTASLLSFHFVLRKTKTSAPMVLKKRVE